MVEEGKEYVRPDKSQKDLAELSSSVTRLKKPKGKHKKTKRKHEMGVKTMNHGESFS